MTQEERVKNDQMFSDLLREMKKHGLQDVAALRKAYNFALKVHGDTRRKTGDPYITHPLSVAMILAEIGHETDIIVSAILHDVVEDCNVTVEQLEKEFGRNVADMVNAVTRKVADCQEIRKYHLRIWMIFRIKSSVRKFRRSTIGKRCMLNVPIGSIILGPFQSFRKKNRERKLTIPGQSSYLSPGRSISISWQTSLQISVLK